MNKAKSQKKHFINRLFERYELNCSENDYTWMILQVKRSTDKCKFLLKQSNRVSVHSLEFSNSVVVVAYDKSRKSLITALPKECINPQNIYSYFNELE